MVIVTEVLRWCGGMMATLLVVVEGSASDDSSKGV